MLLAAILALSAIGDWCIGQIDVAAWTHSLDGLDAAWIAIALIYVLLMALPFVPGIELGLALMLLLGDGGILLVYLCTQVALALSFFAGRWVPMPLLITVLHALRLERMRRLLACLETAGPEKRLVRLTEHAPSAWARRSMRHRYLTLAVVLNLPGNALLGGAGGLGLIAGASRLYRFPGYCLLVAAATSPVPLLLMLRGGAPLW